MADGARENSSVVGAKKLTVGTTPVQLALPQDGINVAEVTVLADDQNGGIIYMGGENVSATTGFKLKADKGLGGICVVSLDTIWVVASLAGQILWIFYTEPPEV